MFTAAQFHQFVDVPPALICFSNIDNPQTRLAYQADLTELSHPHPSARLSPRPGTELDMHLSCPPNDRLTASCIYRIFFGVELDRCLTHDVSRKFVYQQANKASAALAEVFSSSAPDDEVLFELPVTKTWLRQLTLDATLIGHGSYRGVVELMRDLLGVRISEGTVHNVHERFD